jgi:hypothetical protein
MSRLPGRSLPSTAATGARIGTYIMVAGYLCGAAYRAIVDRDFAAAGVLVATAFGMAGLGRSVSTIDAATRDIQQDSREMKAIVLDREIDREKGAPPR